jgi:arsenate reductase (thioredoxin)
MDKHRVLFLCTGNSARSQMAEAIVNRRLGDKWVAFSAGTHPASQVNPLAVRALAEMWIDHQGVPKPISTFLGQPFDLVITLCDDAAQNCPVWLGQGKRMHIGFPDPAEATGSDEEKMTTFRSVRDDLQARILPVLVDFTPS